MELTYLGTATLVISIGGTRLLTDPVFDEKGTAYDVGPWYAPRSWFMTEKRYETPESPASLGAFDAVLLSHDHHADNLDFSGRALVADEARAGRVVTTAPGARRLARPAATRDAPGRGLGLGGRAVGLAPGAKTRVGPLTITAVVARHGPSYLPQVHEVTGFLVDVDDGPRIWISGDTVLFPALESALREIRRQRPVDVAVVHCGAVAFPLAPLPRSARLTFDAREAIAACRMLDANTILPIHRSGWAHFQQPEDDLRRAFIAAGLEERTRFLHLGETLAL